jgi:hypothetical protein
MAGVHTSLLTRVACHLCIRNIALLIRPLVSPPAYKYKKVKRSVKGVLGLQEDDGASATKEVNAEAADRPRKLTKRKHRAEGCQA